MTDLPEPWCDFLVEVDARLRQPVELHCLGGFVLTVCYDSPRLTHDLDFITGVPKGTACELVDLAGKGTPLALKHRLYLDMVGVCDFPDDYEDNLVTLETPHLSSLRLRAFAPHDLMLAKLTRNSDRDRFDLCLLASKGAIDPDILEARYREHLRPYLANEDRHDLSMAIWLETIREVHRQQAEREPGPGPAR